MSAEEMREPLAAIHMVGNNTMLISVKTTASVRCGTRVVRELCIQSIHMRMSTGNTLGRQLDPRQAILQHDFNLNIE